MKKTFLLLFLLCATTSFADDREIVYLDGRAVYADTLNKPDKKPEEVPAKELERRKTQSAPQPAQCKGAT